MLGSLAMLCVLWGPLPPHRGSEGSSTAAAPSPLLQYHPESEGSSSVVLLGQLQYHPESEGARNVMHRTFLSERHLRSGSGPPPPGACPGRMDRMD